MKPFEVRVKRNTLWLAAPFSAVVVLFLIVSTVSLVLASQIDSEVRDLQTNSLPSARCLSKIRTDLTQMAADLGQLSDHLGGSRNTSAAELMRQRGILQQDLQEYALLPWYPGERDLYDRGFLPPVDRLDADLSAVSQDRTPSAETRAIADLADADRAAAKLLDLNHEQSSAAVARVLDKRHDAGTVAVAMNVAAVALALALGAHAVRVSRRLRRLQEDHEALLESRTQELEVFADRVAHDILSPLSAVSFLLGSIHRQQVGPQVQQMTARAMNALGRSRKLVQAIMEFSQSGGRPAPGARADVPEVLQAVIEEASLNPDAPPIRIEHVDDCTVACDESVLSIVLANLLGNAVKYTKDSPTPMIAVRTRRQNAKVRMEVQDSGPGVPHGMEKVIFEPYKRGHVTTQPGLGLGLATVSRFVTRHGGSVGVDRAELGSIFWVELPLAEKVAAQSPSEHVREALPVH